MPAPGLQVAGFRGVLDAEALAARQVRLRVEGAVLRLSAAGLGLLLPPGAPVAVERLAEGRGEFTVEARGIPARVEIEPRASDGRLRLEIRSIRAGRLPLPVFAVRALLRAVLPDRPGLHLSTDNRIEIDLREILRAVGAGVELPPLRDARVVSGMLELEFSI